MTKEQFIKVMMEKKMTISGMLEITLNDGYTCSFGNGDRFWFDWNENEWGCDILGMIPYNSFEEAVYGTANYIYDDLVGGYRRSVVEINEIAYAL